MNQFQNNEVTYKLGNELGRGAFGVTYLATDSKGRKVAIKTIDTLKTGASNLDIKDEINTLKDLSSKGCFKFVACYYDSFTRVFNNVQTAFIVSEYVDGGSLYTIMQQPPERIIPSFLWPIMFQLLLGLKYIHDMGYAHRDIKPDNVLITKNNEIKYIDFGIACVQKCKYGFFGCKNTCKGTAGTIYYMPPEYFNGTGEESLLAAKAHDMWSLGIIFFELCNGIQVYPFDIYNTYSGNQQLLNDNDVYQNISGAPQYSSNYEIDDGRTDRYVNQLLVNNWKKRPIIKGAIDIFTDEILTAVYSQGQ